MKRSRTHSGIDDRSLAMARAVAEKLERDPGLFEIAKENLRRWKKTLVPWPPALGEWERIVEDGLVRAIVNLLDDSPDGRRLRQSHPFPGVLTPQERNEILRRHESTSA